LSLDDLPVPRVIVARVQPGTALDLAALRRRVTQVRRPPASTITAPGSSGCGR
jgi:cell division transport system permease protein